MGSDPARRHRVRVRGCQDNTIGAHAPGPSRVPSGSRLCGLRQRVAPDHPLRHRPRLATRGAIPGLRHTVELLGQRAGVQARSWLRRRPSGVRPARHHHRGPVGHRTCANRKNPRANDYSHPQHTRDEFETRGCTSRSAIDAAKAKVLRRLGGLAESSCPRPLPVRPLCQTCAARCVEATPNCLDSRCCPARRPRCRRVCGVGCGVAVRDLDSHRGGGVRRCNRRRRHVRVSARQSADGPESTHG